MHLPGIPLFLGASGGFHKKWIDGASYLISGLVVLLLGMEIRVN
jgi:hypothetical protein